MSAWLQCAEPRSAPRLRIVCAAHGGGAASAYAEWHHDLPDDIEVWAIQYPGRENRFLEPTVASVDAVVAGVGPEVADLVGETEFALFGHCFGALVCYELAQWLRARGHRGPELLVVSGRGTPDLQYPQPPGGPVHLMSDADLTRYIGEYATVPEELLTDPELVELLLPVVRADAEADSTYRHVPGEPFDFGVLAVGGRSDADAPEDDLLAWRKETRGNFACRMFPGGHFYLRAGQADLLATILEMLGSGKLGVAGGTP
jgi:surfactin synthase thioesterase subunit